MIDSALQLALTQDSVTPLMLLEITFKNGVTRVHSGLGEIYPSQLLRGDYSERSLNSTTNNPAYSTLIARGSDMTVGKTYKVSARIVSTEGERESGWSSRNGIPTSFRIKGAGIVGGTFTCNSNTGDLLLFTFNKNTTITDISVKEIAITGVDDSAKFLGLGDIGKVSVIRQNNGDSPDRLNLTLSSFDDSVRGEALEARYVGQPVKLWLAVLDDDWRIKASQMIWRGSISDGGVTVGENNQITLTVSNRLEDWDKARPDRYTDESQQSRHPGDRIFIYMPQMAEYPIYWGSEKSSIPLKNSV